MALRRGVPPGPKSGRRSSMLMMRGSRCTDGSIIARAAVSAYLSPLPPLSLFLSSSLLLFSIFYGEIYHLRVVYSICFIEITSRAQPLPLAHPDAATTVRRPNFIAMMFEDLLLTRASKIRKYYKHINCSCTFRIYNFRIYILHT